MSDAERRLAGYIWGDGSPDFEDLLRELRSALRDSGLMLVDGAAPRDSDTRPKDGDKGTLGSTRE